MPTQQPFPPSLACTDRAAPDPSGPGSVGASPVGEVHYVSRQPILDVRGRLHGYDLIFREFRETVFRGDRELASRTILDDSVLFGLERYTSGLPAFVECTAETLIEGLVQVLPPSMTVLRIPAAEEPSPELIAACLPLKAAGFRLALDNYTPHRRLQPLAERADYFCCDLDRLAPRPQPQPFQLNAPMPRFKSGSGLSVARLARKVDTLEDFEYARAAGFTLFQGSYFCQPQMLKNRKVPANRFFQFELLRHLNGGWLDLRKISELVLRDAALTYRLLRLVNSPFCALRQEVRSIESAILFLGEDTFRRIATLSILSEFNGGQPPEILQMSLLRARFCALAADTCTLNPAEQYLLGILSLLPAMLGIPMEALTPSLPLRPPIREALEGTPNAERSLLTWLECHERGDWPQCDCLAATHELDVGRLLFCYVEAVGWAKATLHATG